MKLATTNNCLWMVKIKSITGSQAKEIVSDDHSFHNFVNDSHRIVRLFLNIQLRFRAPSDASFPSTQRKPEIQINSKVSTDKKANPGISDLPS
jgi:hypothetical protein